MRPFFETVVGVIRSSAVARGSDVRQVRASTRTALVHYRSARRERREAVRRMLQEHRAATIGSLRSTLAAVSATKTPAPEKRASHQAADAAERVGVWELWSEPARDAEDAVELLQEEVLRAIRAHPEGIRALDLGNELGIDWRWVLGVTAGLIEQGKVEQVEQEFYPVAKAGRRW